MPALFFPLAGHLLLHPGVGVEYDLRTDGNSSRAKLFVIDDHAVARQGVVQLIDHELDLTVCGEAQDEVQALRQIDETQPDLVLLDPTLKSSNGLNLLQTIRAQRPQLTVLILSLHDGPLFIERFMQAGACGYIGKQESSQSLLDAIRKALTVGRKAN